MWTKRLPPVETYHVEILTKGAAYAHYNIHDSQVCLFSFSILFGRFYDVCYPGNLHYLCTVPRVRWAQAAQNLFFINDGHLRE